MKRVQVDLSIKEFALAKREADRLGISIARYSRRCLADNLSADELRPWMRYAGMVDSGDPHASIRIDETIYGRKS